MSYGYVGKLKVR